MSNFQPSGLDASSKDLALSALRANQEHQYALAKHAETLAAQLYQLDKLLPQADIPDEEAELNSDFYIPGSSQPTAPVRNLNNLDSPFHRDGLKRTRYVDFISRHSMSAKENEALKGAVEAEIKRLEASEGTSDILKRLNWSVIAEKVSDASSYARSAEECRIKWQANCNQKPWSSQETQTLQTIIGKRPAGSPINWVDVARELGTNRLPLDCMRHGASRTRHSWTTESDRKILDAVNQYGQSWSLVAKFVASDLTPQQCSGRYARFLDPSVRRGAWTTQEDARLQAAVAGYGPSWSEVASAMPGRTHEQCRERWQVHGTTEGKEMEGWDDEADEQLAEAVEKVGKKWKVVSGLIGKSGNTCRIRYEELIQSGVLRSGANSPVPESVQATHQPARDHTLQGDVAAQAARPQPRRVQPTKKDASAKETQEPVGDVTPKAKKGRPPQKPTASSKKRKAADSEDSDSGPSSKRPRQSAVRGPAQPTAAGVKAQARMTKFENLPRRRSSRFQTSTAADDSNAN